MSEEPAKFKPWEGPGPDPLLLDWRFLRGGCRPYRGSIDRLEEVATFLDTLGIAYTLSVGMQGSPTTTLWSNVRDYGHKGINCFRKAIGFHYDELVEKLLAEGDFEDYDAGPTHPE